jgi:hypothetical protein
MKINLFSSPIFVSNIDLDIVKVEPEGVKNNWNSETLSSFGMNNRMDSASYKTLMNKIAEMLNPIMPAYSKMELLSIWKNEYINNDFQEAHIHCKSHFSFIIYVQGKSKTLFFSPQKYLIESFYDYDFFDKVYESECRPGQIIVFPSYLEHMVKKSSGNITYAGNVKILDIEHKRIEINLPKVMCN